jgi:hypothetical protein
VDATGTIAAMEAGDVEVSGSDLLDAGGRGLSQYGGGDPL